MPKGWTPPAGVMPRPGSRAMTPAAPQHIYWPRMSEEEIPPTLGSGHVHCTITAFHDVNTDGGLSDASSIDVEVNISEAREVGLSIEQYAIARAQALIVRANYRLASVRETCTLDTALKGEK